MAHSTYEVVLNGKVVGTRSSKPAAINLAVETADIEKQDVEVRTSAGTVVETIRGHKVRARNYTRTEALGVKLDVADYVVAYTRKQSNLAVLRSTTLTKNTAKYYMVIDFVTGKKHFAHTTIEAREITNEIRANRLAAKAEAAAAL